MKAKHNCWTCKERKVGCDRALPACFNCQRSNKTCQGYGLKLAWPDKYDGRRKQKNYQAQAVPGSIAPYSIKDGHFQFLNMTLDDLSGRRRKISDFGQAAETGMIRIMPSPGNGSGIDAIDGMLISYYDSVLARMITTVDDNTNGFRLDLMPMALSSSDASSKSLLQATLALSSFHLGRPDDALRYKVEAIKSLSESLHMKCGPEEKVKMLASCMQLCVYSVFDLSDTTWHMHLQGAKSLIEALSEHERSMPCFDFLAPWVDYHDTFSGYSHSTEVPVKDGLPYIAVPESSSTNRKIVGVLGCSTECLRLISCINQLRTLKTSPVWSPLTSIHETTDIAIKIRTRLQNLKQEIHVRLGETTGTIDHQRITITAELYLIAAQLYLFEIAPSQATPENVVKNLVRDGLAILDLMKVCTSPWPLFIVACNVASDMDRLKVLTVLDKANQERKIGNYELIKGLIQAVWKQQDLIADEKSTAQIDWRTLLDPTSTMPSFI